MNILQFILTDFFKIRVRLHTIESQMPRVSEVEQALTSTSRPKRTANWTEDEELNLCCNIHNIVVCFKHYLDGHLCFDSFLFFLHIQPHVPWPQ